MGTVNPQNNGMKLVDVSFPIPQATREDKDSVAGTSKTFQTMPRHLDSVEHALLQAHDDPRVYRLIPEGLLQNFIKKEDEMSTSLHYLAFEQSRNMLNASLRDVDANDQEMEYIVRSLHEPQDRQIIPIQMVQAGMGLNGHRIDGSQVAYQARGDTNAGSAVGSQGLRLGRALEDVISEQPEGVDRPATEAVDQQRVTSNHDARFYTDNLQTGDNFAMFQGDIGFEERSSGMVGRHSETRNVKFGNDAQLGQGDVSKSAAADFFNAWGRH